VNSVLRMMVSTASAVAASGSVAHAFLDHATPPVGSATRVPPTQVRLWFTEQLEPAFSTLKVLNAEGRQVDKQDKTVDRANPVVLQVSLPQLTPGKYKVVWRALSVDTHVTEGDYTFSVAPSP
jgi:methionine-rich copper-binding protein CopC